ncbi:MAG: hypothetical protein R2851_09780 [Caldilineaceae bacterium]
MKRFSSKMYRWAWWRPCSSAWSSPRAGQPAASTAEPAAEYRSRAGGAGHA